MEEDGRDVKKGHSGEKRPKQSRQRPRITAKRAGAEPIETATHPEAVADRRQAAETETVARRDGDSRMGGAHSSRAGLLRPAFVALTGHA